MSIFKKPLLKSETITIVDQELTLFELSAYDRCEYLAAVAPDVAFDGAKEEEGSQSVRQVMEVMRDDTEYKLLLVAYSLRPSLDAELEAIMADLKRELPRERVDDLYVPATKLSGLHVQGVNEKK